MTTITYRAPDGTEAKQKVPPAYGGHRIEWTVSHDFVRGELTCVADVGGFCRLSCAEECGAESWPCVSWDDDGPREHAMVDCGHCHALLFMEDLNAEESYDGPSRVAVSGPVLIEWTGDTYVWRYPSEVES